MAVDDPKTVDVVSVDRATSEVILDVTDHLDWSNEADHLMFLQNKINAYVAFIESGELEAAYPDAKGRQPVIRVACMNKPPPVAVRFFDRVRDILQPADIRFSFRNSHFNSPPEKRFRKRILPANWLPRGRVAASGQGKTQAQRLERIHSLPVRKKLTKENPKLIEQRRPIL